MRRWRWLVLILAVLVAAPVVGALVPRPLFPPADPASGEPRRRILVLANPIHTDIAFRRSPTSSPRSAFSMKQACRSTIRR